MRALTVIPHRDDSAELTQVPEPADEPDKVLIETHAVGVCGTDMEIVRGLYGWAPPGKSRLILGHESVGRVLDAPSGSGLQVGDWVVGIVRRPDPLPCPNCAIGEWDMCRNGRYTEHGIKELDGFAVERHRLDADALVRIDPCLEELGVLLEPASVLAKAWEHIERIGARALFAPQQVLVTGAGPIGLLAALLGRQRGLEVHVLDRNDAGPKPDLVRALGATYHVADADWTKRVPPPDIVLECTGVGSLVLEVIALAPSAGIVCLTGVSSGRRRVPVDADALNREMVLENNVVFGSVNANRRHYEAAADALARADQDWLRRLLTRRVPLDRWREALERRPDDVKPFIDLRA